MFSFVCGEIGLIMHTNYYNWRPTPYDNQDLPNFCILLKYVIFSSPLNLFILTIQNYCSLFPVKSAADGIYGRLRLEPDNPAGAGTGIPVPEPDVDFPIPV